LFGGTGERFGFWICGDAELPTVGFDVGVGFGIGDNLESVGGLGFDEGRFAGGFGLGGDCDLELSEGSEGLFIEGFFSLTCGVIKLIDVIG
jgi:hypothetical protein